MYSKNNSFYRFAHFLHIISPSDEMLEKMIPRVYWSIENVELSEDMQNKLIKNFPQDYKKSKSAYNEASEKIKKLLNRNLLSLFLNHIKY